MLNIGTLSIVRNVAIPFGYAVDLCSEDGFGGEIKTIRGPFYDDQTLHVPCVNLDKDNEFYFDQLTKSLLVYKTAQLGKAQGYWLGYSHTSQADFNIRYGF